MAIESSLIYLLKMAIFQFAMYHPQWSLDASLASIVPTSLEICPVRVWMEWVLFWTYHRAAVTGREAAWYISGEKPGDFWSSWIQKLLKYTEIIWTIIGWFWDQVGLGFSELWDDGLQDFFNQFWDDLLWVDEQDAWRGALSIANSENMAIYSEFFH